MSRKWVILDVMGVIFEVGSAEQINELYLKASLGEISSFDFWKGLGFGDEYPEIERAYLDTCLRIDAEFTWVTRKLRESYSLAILSNDVKEWSDYLRTKFDLNRLFNVIIVSSEVGCRKPDKKIYNIFLDRIKSPPSDCVFVDDRSENLRPASEIGIKTIKFAREESKDDFLPDFEIRSFAELPKVIEKVF